MTTTDALLEHLVNLHVALIRTRGFLAIRIRDQIDATVRSIELAEAV